MVVQEAGLLYHLSYFFSIFMQPPSLSKLLLLHMFSHRSWLLSLFFHVDLSMATNTTSPNSTPTQAANHHTHTGSPTGPLNHGTLHFFVQLSTKQKDGSITDNCGDGIVWLWQEESKQQLYRTMFDSLVLAQHLSMLNGCLSV